MPRCKGLPAIAPIFLAIVSAFVITTGAVTVARDGTANAAAASNNEREHRCLALALYFESRGESERGMTAVGWTILNRVASSEFPDSPCGVVQQGGETPPCQFSWWCDGKSDRPRDRAAWRRAQVAAARLLTDPPADPTRGALYFVNRSVSPGWLRSLTRTVRIGNHVFYR